MRAAIIDYGMGNLLSVQRAFEKCGAEAVIIEDPKLLRNAEHIVLPGVGAFLDAMEHLNHEGWIEELNQAVLEEKTPLLGICLGMQLLATQGYEGEPCKGLGYIKGEVIRLFPQQEISQQEMERIPHVGWNEIQLCHKSSIFEGIKDGTNFYFVHSYHLKTQEEEDVASRTPYCGGFVSAVMKGNIVGTQFHPEKSQKAGFQVIRNFLKMGSGGPIC